MDPAFLGNRLLEVTQEPSSAQAASLCRAGIERMRKCLQGENCVRHCHSTHTVCFQGFLGEGQQKFPTQILRVRLLGIDPLPKIKKIQRRDSAGRMVWRMWPCSSLLGSRLQAYQKSWLSSARIALQGFRYRGTSAKTTLLRTPELTQISFEPGFGAYEGLAQK